MKSIARYQFLDLLWDVTQFDAAGRFWLELFGVAASHYGYRTTAKYSIEIRLASFPRVQAGALCSILEDRAKEGLPDSNTCFGGPDTLILTSAYRSTSVTPPAGLGLPMLAGPDFEGLVAEFRLRVVGRTKLDQRIDITMVVVGELCEGALRVKAVWRSIDGRKEEDWYRYHPMGGELELVGAIDEFRKVRTVVRTNLAYLFLPPPPESPGEWLKQHLLSPPGDRPRALGLILRFTLFASLTTLFVEVCYRSLPNNKIRPADFVAGCIGMLGVPLLWMFLRRELRALFTYRTLRSQFAEHYKEPIHYVIISSPEELAVLDADPALRKYTADLISEGFVPLGDVRDATVSESRRGYRTFLAPDEHTYLTIGWSRDMLWPASTEFQAQTFVRSGGRIESAGFIGMFAFVRQPLEPGTLIRASLASTDPVEFYLQHVSAAERFASKRGLTLAPHERLEEFVRRQEAIHAAEREYYTTHPYSWGDHLRWYLQWPRWEQRG